MTEHEPEFYEKLIYENEPKGYQLKLVVNEFRGLQYIHLRKYFLSYEGEYIPSREGVSMEASIHNILSLLEGLMEICSFEESDATILEFFSAKLATKNSSLPETL
jgi:hypothetical protein